MLSARSVYVCILVILSFSINCDGFFKKIPKFKEPLELIDMPIAPSHDTNILKLFTKDSRHDESTIPDDVKLIQNTQPQVQIQALRRIPKKGTISEQVQPLENVAKSVNAVHEKKQHVVLYPRLQPVIKTLIGIIDKNIKSTVSDQHLNSVAKSMKTVLAANIQPTIDVSKELKSEAQGLSSSLNRQVQSHLLERIPPKVKVNVDMISKPIAKSVKATGVTKVQSTETQHSFESVAKSMNAVVTNIFPFVSQQPLESVAKSMKAAVATRVQPPRSEDVLSSSSKSDGFHSVHSSHLDQEETRPVTKPLHNRGRFNFRNSETEDEKPAVLEKSVIQGFKVEGDSANTVVFLDLDALKATGISLDNSHINVGSDGRRLHAIEGLKTNSPNFQSVVDQKLQSDPKVVQFEPLKFPSQPSVVIKHVAASQAFVAHKQVARGSSNQVSISATQAQVIRPQKNLSSTRRQALFFGKFQGQESRKPSASLNQVLQLPTSKSPRTFDHQQPVTPFNHAREIQGQGALRKKEELRSFQIHSPIIQPSSELHQPVLQHKLHDDLHYPQQLHFGFRRV